MSESVLPLYICAYGERQMTVLLGGGFRKILTTAQVLFTPTLAKCPCDCLVLATSLLILHCLYCWVLGLVPETRFPIFGIGFVDKPVRVASKSPVTMFGERFY